MEGGLGASDHRRAVPEPMAIPGGIGLFETPEDAVGTPVAPGCSSYGPTPPRHGAHTREKRTTPRNFFLRAVARAPGIIYARRELITSIAGLRMKFELEEVRFYSRQTKGLRWGFLRYYPARIRWHPREPVRTRNEHPH